MAPNSERLQSCYNHLRRVVVLSDQASVAADVRESKHLRAIAPA